MGIFIIIVLCGLFAPGLWLVIWANRYEIKKRRQGLKPSPFIRPVYKIGYGLINLAFLPLIIQLIQQIAEKKDYWLSLLFAVLGIAILLGFTIIFSIREKRRKGNDVNAIYTGLNIIDTAFFIIAYIGAAIFFTGIILCVFLLVTELLEKKEYLLLTFFVLSGIVILSGARIILSIRQKRRKGNDVNAINIDINIIDATFVILAYIGGSMFLIGIVLYMSMFAKR